MRNRNLVFGLCLSLFLLWASCVYAEGSFKKGATEWGISGGFGNNFHIGMSGTVSEDIQSYRSKNVSEDIGFYFLTPSWGKVLEKWGRYGSLEFVTEGFLSYAQQDSKDRYGVGITPLFAYNFESLGRAVIFLELGAGILYTDLDPEDFGSHINFTPQGGDRCSLRNS